MVSPTATTSGSRSLRDLWDFDDPVGSERRFRALAETGPREAAIHAWTQVARALGLQERYDEAHAVLDTLETRSTECDVRICLERGRLFRSVGEGSAALPRFHHAARAAEAAGLEELHVDALHMLALVVPPADRLPAQHTALSAARGAKDPAARDWDATLLNNIGVQQAELGDHAGALASFEGALAARERIGDAPRTRVARFMVGWALRNMGDEQGALELQRALKADLDALGERDAYVEDELALLERADDEGSEPRRR